MSKAKRLKAQKNKPRTVRMNRGDLKAYLCNVIDHSDDESLEKIQVIFLTLTGVIDREGNLTEAHAKSPYWRVEGSTLRPANDEELKKLLSKDVRKVLEIVEKERPDDGR